MRQVMLNWIARVDREFALPRAACESTRPELDFFASPYSGAVIRLMSFFANAQHTPIHIQDATLTAVGGNQNNHAMMVAGPTHIAGNQNNYQGSLLKGTSPRLSLLSDCLTIE